MESALEMSTTTPSPTTLENPDSILAVEHEAAQDATTVEATHRTASVMGDTSDSWAKVNLLDAPTGDVEEDRLDQPHHPRPAQRRPVRSRIREATQETIVVVSIKLVLASVLFALTIVDFIRVVSQ